jgi:S-adenosylmethionine:tRNA ribosyltransferase-isomerase
MKRSDFDYSLPDELIARYPLEQRSASRLLCLDKKSAEIEHRHYQDVLELLNPGDCLVFNDTRVIPARLFGQRETGGKVEVMVERLLDNQHCLAHVRISNKVRVGLEIRFDNDFCLRVIDKRDDLYELESIGAGSLIELMEQQGHMPLPPYIDRDDESLDRERYQTVYAKNQGAVAAPTAGLHFDDELLTALTAKGIEFAHVTLHVGAGTFQPVRVDDIKDHQMHAEFLQVSESVCDKIARTKKAGGRVIAVGTTSVRCLETAAQEGGLKPFQGDTEIFIYPGYKFKVIDGLLTNFHLPESTLIMLVSALAGQQSILHAYQQAIDEKYRFFSYGDAMFIS